MVITESGFCFKFKPSFVSHLHDKKMQPQLAMHSNKLGVGKM